MKRITLAILFIAVTAVCGTASAQAGKMAVGGYLGAGFGFAAGDGPEELININPFVNIDRSDRTAKFSGAFGAYFDYYFTSMWAIETGIGFHSHGAHWKFNGNMGKVRHFYMELPILAKIDFRNFHFGFGLALWFNLSGKTTTEFGNTKTETTWSGDDWDYFHRVNIGPKLYAGYAIPVGPVFIVPSVSWSFHMVNDIDRNQIEDDVPGINTDNFRSRYNNLLLNAAVEWQF